MKTPRILLQLAKGEDLKLQFHYVLLKRVNITKHSIYSLRWWLRATFLNSWGPSSEVIPKCMFNRKVQYFNQMLASGHFNTSSNILDCWNSPQICNLKPDFQMFVFFCCTFYLNSFPKIIQILNNYLTIDIFLSTLWLICLNVDEKRFSCILKWYAVSRGIDLLLTESKPIDVILP